MDQCVTRFAEGIDYQVDDLLDEKGQGKLRQELEQVAQEAANVGKMLASLGKLIGLLNLFLGMLGLPEVPDLSKLAGCPLDAIIEPIGKLIHILETARSAVPLP